MKSIVILAIALMLLLEAVSRRTAACALFVEEAILYKRLAVDRWCSLGRREQGKY